MMHWIWKGKTIVRALFNDALSGTLLKGHILDVGETKAPSPSYMRVLHINGDVQVINIDQAAYPDIVADAEMV